MSSGRSTLRAPVSGWGWGGVDVEEATIDIQYGCNLSFRQAQKFRQEKRKETINLWKKCGGNTMGPLREQQPIQSWTSATLTPRAPIEHVGMPPSNTTQRVARPFSAATTLANQGVYQTPATVHAGHPRTSLSSQQVTMGDVGGGAANPASCRAAGDGLYSAMARRAAHFSVISLDASGRRRRQGGEPFVVSIRGPGAVTTSVRDCQDGTYSVGWVANVSGVYWIVISLHGEHIAGSPFSATVSVPHAEARQCKVTGVGLQEAVAGQAASFRIEFADLGGRAVPAESLDLALDVEGGGGRRDAAHAAGFSLGGLSAVEGGPEGAYHAKYTVGRAGRYELHVRLRASGESLPGSPYRLVVHAGAAHAPTTELPVEEVPVRSSAGVPYSLVVRAVDRLHNPCGKGGDKFEAEVIPADGKPRTPFAHDGLDGFFDDDDAGVGGAGSSDVRVSTRDLGDGNHEVRWYGELRRMYTLAVRLRGAHVGGSPVLVRMMSGRPDPANCAMRGDGLRGAHAGKEAAISVTCKDRFGNLVDADVRTRMWLEFRASAASPVLPHYMAATATSPRHAPPSDAPRGDAASADVEEDRRGLQSCEGVWADDGLHELRYVTTRAGTFDVLLWCEHDGEAFVLLTAPAALSVKHQPPTFLDSKLLGGPPARPHAPRGRAACAATDAPRPVR